ncbi:MAG: DNA repair protein RecO [Candidatus Dojkabacteria bacterium]
MRSYRDTGYILKTRPLGEADRLVIVFSKNHGKIEAVAKGARKPLSRKAGNIDLLNLVNFAFHKGKNLDIVTEAELVDDFDVLKRDLPTISEIFYILELLDRFLSVDLDSKLIYKTLQNFLTLMSQSGYKNSALMLGLELKLLDYLGFGPDLTSCLHCGQQLKEDVARIAASKGMAGYLCSEHFNTLDYPETTVSNTVIKLQRLLLSKSLGLIKSIKINLQLENRVKSIQDSWIRGILEADLKSLMFLEEVRTKHGNRRKKG